MRKQLALLWALSLVLLAVGCQQVAPPDSRTVMPSPGSTWAQDPHLLKSVGAYNIVAFHDKIYGVPQSLGAVDWRGQDVASMKGVVTGRTEQEVLMQLHDTAWSDDPRLLKSVGTYNIVAFHDKIYAVPQSLGAVDWLGHDVGSMKGVVTGRTEQEVLDGLPRPK
jgi:hypothetical protein